MDLKLIELIHKITQADYKVQFNGDFEGMVRIDFLHEYQAEFYEHCHVGYPDQPREKLKKAVEEALESFISEHNIT